jgi:ligand-binding SRPBCC domain-containing protein
VPTFVTRSWVAASRERTFAFFDDPSNLARLMPPGAGIRVVRVEPSPPTSGTEIEFRYGTGPLRRTWLVRYLEHVPGERIVDETISGPLRRFHHSHTFRTAANGGTWIEDRVDYHVGPDGEIGVVADAFAGLAMRGVFLWRRAMQRRILGGRGR